MHTFKHLTLAASISLAGLACAGSEVPAKHLADAESSIRAAEELGAQSRPEAALQLKMANDRLTQARALVAEGENERAARLLEEARVSAELAVLLSRQEEAEARALKAQEQASKYDQPQGTAKTSAETP